MTDILMTLDLISKDRNSKLQQIGRETRKEWLILEKICDKLDEEKQKIESNAK
jgi:hypothetical protein